ncbi:MAG: TetR/AcrR family transcriptional regulator [Gammaproteobacteria bacterium]
MTAQAKITTGTARERILEVATDLFYRQGYRATGINEVIDKSGVAKATFYNHFPSKDVLCKDCLNGLSDNELHFVDSAIHNANGPLDRFLSVIQSLEPWARDTEFRGCAFMNIASEVPEPDSPLRKVGTKLYDEIRLRVEKLTSELIESNKEKYGHLDVDTVSKCYLVAFAGAVALAEIYHAIWPIHDAVNSVRRMIGE